MAAFDTRIQNTDANRVTVGELGSSKHRIDVLCLTSRGKTGELASNDVGFAQFSQVIQQTGEATPLFKPCVSKNDYPVRKPHSLTADG